MNLGKGNSAGGAARLLSVLALVLALGAGPASSADPPRRAAIAPFANLSGQEEIRGTVSILPRLLSTRIMALAGADVVLLPPGGKAPEEAAKEAACNLLIQGAVAKVGKGYSIDVTAVDLAGGKPAGSFFVAAPSEDDIIPQMGVLAADIAESLYGVKRAPAPQPAPSAAAVPAPVPPLPGAAQGVPHDTASRASAVPAGAPAGAATPPATGTVGVPSPAAASQGPGEGWDPARVVKVGMSDKIPGEVYRVAAGDIDGDGSPEIVAVGGRTIWFYQIKGTEIVPFRPGRIDRTLAEHLLNVEVFDADGDGRPEIFVTNLAHDRLRSFVLRYRNGVFETEAVDIPYYIVVLSDVDGKPALAGQATGFEEIFRGKVVLLRYANGKVTEERALKVAPEAGIFGLNAVRVGADGKYVYVDVDEHLRLWNEKGKTLSKTKDYFARGSDHVTRGPIPRGEVSPRQTWIRGRVIPIGGAPGSPFLLTRQAEGATVFKESRSFGTSRVVVGRFEGSSFSIRAAGEAVESLITDAVPAGPSGGGTLVAATVLESALSVFSEAASRLYLYRVE